METPNEETTADVLDRINTIEDVLRELGEEDEDVIIYTKLLTLFDQACHTVNYQLAVLITKALNEKWIPNWDNTSEWKYANWYDMGSSGFRFGVYGSWGSDSGVGSRLCFKERRLGKAAAEKFPQVFEQFLTIKK